MAFTVKEKYIQKIDYTKLAKDFTKQETIISTGNIHPKSYDKDETQQNTYKNIKPLSDKEFNTINL